MSDNNSLLANKVAIITGASRGIGRAIALELGRMGAYVIANYNSSYEAAQEVLEELKTTNAAGAEIIKADVGKSDEAQNLVNEVLNKHQRVDILINNAGIQKAVLVHKMTDADWHDVINTNLSSVFYMCRAVLPSMIAAKKGHIVNIGSASGFMGHKGAASYVSSKHALTGLTRVLAMETGDKGIQVNTVAPGVTETDMIASLTDVARERLLAGIAMKRVASPQEVADMVIFVLTKATYSTGNTFHISGGLIMQ
jgi:3-oxoacyl-[acyl-carrier protein] reductase